MELKLKRFYDDGDCTLGLMYVDGAFFCFTLEDEYREKKVSMETRIPAGKYKVDWQYIETPLTLKYRDKYPFFHLHIHIKDVPGFDGIYIHSGNTDEHTAGCVLVGDSCQSKATGEGKIFYSARAYHRLYETVKRSLDVAEPVTIEILDEE